MTHTTKNRRYGAEPVASEGTAGCASAAVEVCYADSEHGMRVRVVGEWTREDFGRINPESPSMNALMLAVLRQQPVIHRVRMLCGEYRSSIPFCVFEVAHRWFDCTQREVIFA